MMKSTTEYNLLKTNAEKALQIETICAIVEDHPHKLSDLQVSSIASLLKELIVEVSLYLQGELTKAELTPHSAPGVEDVNKTLVDPNQLNNMLSDQLLSDSDEIVMHPTITFNFNK